MTSTYDHRIIQGAESGSFLRRIDQLLQGEDDFYESVARVARDPGQRRHQRLPGLRIGARRSRRRPPPAPRPRRRPTPSCCRRSRPRPRCSRPTAPTATWRPASTRSAREPKGDPAIEPENLNLTPGADVADPGLDPAHRRRGRDAARGAAADARGLLRDDRLPDRAPRLAPAADVAAGDDRDRRPPHAARRADEKRALLSAADRGLPVRALPAEGLPRARRCSRSRASTRWCR